MNMSQQPVPVVPFSFDLSTLVPRSVASLYSNLVTRPTGRALRIGIETQIGELGGCCLSVLDFTQVVVLDYSCADEAVAKLILRYTGADRPADAYFVARGVGEQHRDPIEAVLARHGLMLVAEVEDAGFTLLGEATPLERRAWAALQLLRRAHVEQIAASIHAEFADAAAALAKLLARRSVLRDGGERYLALSALLAS
jgi:hypothetical protein